MDKKEKRCCVCNSTKEVVRFKGGDLYCSKHYNQMYRFGYTYEKPKKRKENKYVFKDDYIEVITVKNEIILISKEDYELVKEYYWSLNSQGYPISVIKGKHKRLHLLILDKPEGKVIDHMNGNILDNRRCNLRICTIRENSMNTKVSKNNKLGVLGVSKTKQGKYRARIMVNRKEIRLGNFDKLEDAIKARKEAEIKYFKEYSPTLSRLNQNN